MKKITFLLVTCTIFGASSFSVQAATNIFTDMLNMSNHKITNLLDPTDAQDAATKSYVDDLINGLTWKAPVEDADGPTGGLGSYGTCEATKESWATYNKSESVIYVCSGGVWVEMSSTVGIPDLAGEVTGSISSNIVADGVIDSANVIDGSIVNADVKVSAAIAGTKVSPDFGGQDVVTMGNVGIGTTNPGQALHVGNGDVSNYTHLDSSGAYGYHFRRSRGTESLLADVQEGDDIGHLMGLAYRGGDYRISSYINLTTDGAPGADYVPGKIGFYTTAPTGGNPAFRMVIDNEGHVGIGNSDPSKELDVDGDINFTGNLYQNDVLIPFNGGDIKRIGTSLVASFSGPGGTGSSEGTSSNLYNNFFGNLAGFSNVGGQGNNFFGDNAGYSNTEGDDNNFMGDNAGRSNTIGDNNNFFGYSTGYSNVGGKYNNFFGMLSGYSNTEGDDNNFFGRQTGYFNTTGDDNNFFGYLAGFSNIGGDDNNFFGQQAGRHNTEGYDNNFLGYQAGYSNTVGKYNNFVGSRTGYSNISGDYNNFFGYTSGYKNTIGDYNNFMGFAAGFSNIDGSDNNFFGFQTGRYNEDGSYNNFLGNYSGYSNTEGDANNFLGYRTGNYNTSGSYNNFLGNYAGRYNTTGYSNNFIGERAGYSNTTGDDNNFIGTYAGRYNTTGDSNVFIGNEAGYSNSVGRYNTFIGHEAGEASLGDRNIAIGYDTQVPISAASDQINIGNIIYKTSGGNVGIGDSSPDAKLDVNGDIKGDTDINTKTGTTYTLTLNDRSSIVEMTSSSANTIYIPSNTSVSFPVGTTIKIIQYGAGQTTLRASSGVTLNGASSGSKKVNDQYKGLFLYKRASNEWIATNK